MDQATSPSAVTPLDPERVRARFPALLAQQGVVHADAPGGTQIVDSALDAMRDYLVNTNANAHGQFETSRATDQLSSRARRTLGAFLDSDPDGVVFGPNMTTLAFHLSHALDEVLATGGEIVCTRLDHDANVAPWLALADRTGARVRWVELTAEGGLDLATLEAAVTARTRLIAFPRASNALGTVVDPAPLVAAARAVGALTVMDAVHAAPHLPLQRATAGVDVLFCSPYKFFGPHAGVMAADPALLERLTPDKVRPAPDEGPERWQTGTAAFEGQAGAEAAARYLGEIGMDAVGRHEQELATRFLAGLAELPRYRLHGPPTAEGRTPTFALTHERLAPAELTDALAARRVLTWAGHFYAVEPLRALGLLDRGGVLRIGFVHYHTADDVDQVLEALAAADAAA